MQNKKKKAPKQKRDLLVTFEGSKRMRGSNLERRRVYYIRNIPHALLQWLHANAKSKFDAKKFDVK